MPVLDQERRDINTDFNWIVGINIRRIRLMSNVDMGQQVLADKANMDITRLSRVEGGERALNFREGLAIAKALGVKPWELIRPIK